MKRTDLAGANKPSTWEQRAEALPADNSLAATVSMSCTECRRSLSQSKDPDAPGRRGNHGGFLHLAMGHWRCKYGTDIPVDVDMAKENPSRLRYVLRNIPFGGRLRTRMPGAGGEEHLVGSARTVVTCALSWLSLQDPVTMN